MAKHTATTTTAKSDKARRPKAAAASTSAPTPKTPAEMPQTAVVATAAVQLTVPDDEDGGSKSSEMLDEINTAHCDCQRLAQAACNEFCHLGRRLSQAREAVGEAGWSDWLSRHAGISASAAGTCTRFAADTFVQSARLTPDKEANLDYLFGVIRRLVTTAATPNATPDTETHPAVPATAAKIAVKASNSGLQPESNPWAALPAAGLNESQLAASVAQLLAQEEAAGGEQAVGSVEERKAREAVLARANRHFLRYAKRLYTGNPLIFAQVLSGEVSVMEAIAAAG